MKLMNRSWGSWGLVLLLVGSLMVPVVSQALPRGGDIMLGGYEDTESPGMEIIGDPDDGPGGRPQPAELSAATTARLLVAHAVRARVDARILARYPVLCRALGLEITGVLR